MKEISCCFTGHRQLYDLDETILKSTIEEQISRLVALGVRRFFCGGAIGFDTIAAVCVLKQKKLLPDIRLILALPCKSQAKYFNKYERQTYNYIMERADEVVYTSDKYLPGCMLERNKYMVDNCAYCICFMRKLSGGTYYTAQYARNKGLEIIYI